MPRGDERAEAGTSLDAARRSAVRLGGAGRGGLAHVTSRTVTAKRAGSMLRPSRRNVQAPFWVVPVSDQMGCDNCLVHGQKTPHVQLIDSVGPWLHLHSWHTLAHALVGHSCGRT